METHFAGQVYPGDRREVIAYMEEVCADDSILIYGLGKGSEKKTEKLCPFEKPGVCVCVCVCVC